MPFTGQCAVHRGQLMRVRGEFARAVEELEQAVERYVAAETPEPAGLAMKECGDVLLICGDLDGARAAYERAISFGLDPQPGLALLWLARGRTDAGLAATRRLLAEPRDPVHRSQLLPSAVDALLATGHADEAAPLALELGEIAATFGCAALAAWAAFADGGVRTALGDPAAGVRQGRASLRAWQALGAPYEAARCRLLIGRALLELGDPDSAAVELTAAQAGFAQVGATRAERDVAALLESEPPSAGSPNGRWRCCGWSPRGRATRRSPPSCSCPRRPSPGTSPTSSPRSTCRRARPPPPSPSSTTWRDCWVHT